MKKNTLILIAFSLTSVSQAIIVNVFDNPSYVGTGGLSSDESDTVQSSLSGLGHTVNTFTGFGASDWTNAFATAGAVLIPELEDGNLNASLDVAARTAISNSVSSGGRLIVMGAHSTSNPDVFMNSVFGWSLGSATFTSSGSSFLNATNALGTDFAGGAASLANYSGSRLYGTSTLPVAAKSIYESGAQTLVFDISVGSGGVTYLGWDWFNAAPLGSFALDGWGAVLDTAVTQVPEASSYALLAGILTFASVAVRRRR